MNEFLSRLSIFVSLFAVAFIGFGCVSFLKNAKTAVEPTTKEQAKSSTEQLKQDQTSKKPSDEELKKLLSTPPPPKYNPPTGEGPKAATESAVDPGEKEQVSQAAIEFASHMKNVKHVKICYSKLYGGWYLMTYVSKGKKISLDQYSWNKKSQEWEIVYHLKEVPQKQLEFHLKGEVGDEKCFVLK